MPSAPPRPPLEFSGYIVAGTAASGGAMEGALLLRPLALVGSGSKLVRYYNFGPEYMFPANSYSESENITLLLAEIAKANTMIAAAEHVLWPARRSHAQVAILYVNRGGVVVQNAAIILMLNRSGLTPVL